MKLTEQTKNMIIEEYEAFKEEQYAGKSKEERKALGQFFTPAELTIKLIEMTSGDDLSNQTILDPCCGSGNILAACILAGANPKNIYGNELDLDMLKLCRKRLDKLCDKYGFERVPEYQLHRGNALDPHVLDIDSFNKDYKYTEYIPVTKKKSKR